MTTQKMTGVDIDNMMPGPKMNALVAEKIMGLKPGVDFGEWAEHDWFRDENGEIDEFAFDCDKCYGPVCKRCNYYFCLGCKGEEGYATVEPCIIEPAHYSTNILFALEIEEKLSKMSGHIQVGYVSRLYEILNIPFNKPMPLSTGESLKLIRATPEQRCRAALKAVMGIY